MLLVVTGAGFFSFITYLSSRGHFSFNSLVYSRCAPQVYLRFTTLSLISWNTYNILATASGTPAKCHVRLPPPRFCVILFHYTVKCSLNSGKVTKQSLLGQVSGLQHPCWEERREAVIMLACETHLTSPLCTMDRSISFFFYKKLSATTNPQLKSRFPSFLLFYSFLAVWFPGLERGHCRPCSSCLSPTMGRGQGDARMS